jgi:hypothetical protein
MYKLCKGTLMTKIKAWLKRFWHGPEPPVITTYSDIDHVEHVLLKPNNVEYRFPVLLKPPKVKFRMRPIKDK